MSGYDFKKYKQPVLPKALQDAADLCRLDKIECAIVSVLNIPVQTLNGLTKEGNTSKSATFKFVDEGYGYLRGKKTSPYDDLSCYDFTGIQFTVYTDNACTKPAKIATGTNAGETAVLTCKKSGQTNKIALLAGKYWVKETYVPKSSGYSINSEVIEVYVDAYEGSTTTVTLFKLPNSPKMDPIGVLLQKKDSETSDDGRRVGR